MNHLLKGVLPRLSLPFFLNQKPPICCRLSRDELTRTVDIRLAFKLAAPLGVETYLDEDFLEQCSGDHNQDNYSNQSIKCAVRLCPAALLFLMHAHARLSNNEQLRQQI